MSHRVGGSRAHLALWGMLLLGGVVIALTVRDYGVAWDEKMLSRHGELVLDYFLSAGAERSSHEYHDLRFYGPPVDLAAAAIYRWAPEHKFEVRHALSALCALLTALALFRYGALLGTPWLGVIAGAVLLTMPVFYGHAFINAKDVPFACAFAWASFAIARWFARGAFRWREAVLCGLGIGFAVAVRPGAWFFVAPFLAAAALYSLFVRREPAFAGSPRLALQLLAALAVAWLAMVAPWPWAHENPFRHPLEAIGMATAFHAEYEVFFEGRFTTSDELPRHYLIKYLAIRTPPAVLVVAAIGVLAGSFAQLRDPKTPRSLAIFVLQLWLFAPIALWTVLTPNIYDGLRHFLFVLPALALWFGIGAIFLVTLRPEVGLRIAAALLLAGVLIWPVRDLVRLHPYQMTYFNSLVGGLATASHQYETDYWATSYREAIEWVNERAADEPPGSVRVLVAANEYSEACARTFLADSVEMEWIFPRELLKGNLPPGYDYYVGINRFGMHLNFPGAPVVHTVGREGAVFAVIRRRSAPRSPASPSFEKDLRGILFPRG